MSARGDGIFRHPLSWHSRIFRTTAALLLLVLTVRLLWGWHTHRTVSTLFEELRRQGHPTRVEDVVFEPVPQGQNAWHFQQLAAGAMVPGVDSPANSNIEYPNHPPYPPEWWQLAEASERSHARVFSLARQARQRSRVQFRDGLTSPMFMTLLPYLNQARGLANTLGDGALLAHLKGNDAEALDRAADALHLARSLRQDHFHISQLVAIGVESLALHRLQVIAPGLQLARPRHAGTRDRAVRLIRDLLDEGLVWRGRTESVRAEQLGAIDTSRWLAGPTWFIRPLADRQIVRDLRNLLVAIEASRHRNKPDAEAALAGIRPEPTEPPAIAFLGSKAPTVVRYSRWFHAGFGQVSPRYFETTFRTLADRRATAVSLAAQLYRADHGAWPAQLQDLVPAYLPAVPADPYHADGRPLGYVVRSLPDGTSRPLVSFDAGVPGKVIIHDHPMFGWQTDEPPSRRTIDQYRDLSRFAPPPSPVAVDDDPEEPDAPRDEPEQ